MEEGERTAVFLDLQGTLGGEGRGSIMEFSFFPGAIEAIKAINKHELLAIIITNQAHISMGYFTFKEYEKRLEELKQELNEKGAFLNAVYCCPHGANECSCRKPLPGMIEKALHDFNINISNSYIVGDSGTADMALAQKVGAKGILVHTGSGERSLTISRHKWADYEPAYIADNILDAVNWILEDLN
jgi:histidinol-phosphate phosphatase family protein